VTRDIIGILAFCHQQIRQNRFYDIQARLGIKRLRHFIFWVLANDNNAGQVVISGTPEAVESVMSQVKSKKAVKLNVSGAFHSPLMADAAAQFQTILDSVEFKAAQMPVLSNVDPIPSRNAGELKKRLSQQMTGSVRWREISLKLPEEYVDRVVEVGPGKVLTGIIKRTCPDLMLENVSSLADLPG